ncbi:TonB-dependent receptor [Kineobactrum salinum]|uniref:TonB-dependent receptor n=1 Tax=Kineobactrum salinum TaxID=2708301 RepID=A0A6C0U4T1_9GAMM|nr:TonB-dependent receptor [Kineobactrum salinum]QIB67006.1 TonB-dependent receptor [Kineobactrum salinum]
MGGYYQDGTEDSAQVIPGLSESSQRDKSKAWAVFGEGGYRFDVLEATAGLRYFHDRRTQDAVVVGIPPLARVEGSYHTLNPKFTLSWHLNDNSHFYGTVSKGFRSGQNQPASALFVANLSGIDVPTQIDPETLWSYEIGNKSILMNGKLTMEGALYYNDWKDLQVAITAGGIVGALVNAGEAHSLGAELAVSYRPVRGLNLAISGNVNESKLDSTVPTAFNKGDRIFNVPRYTLTASATYTAPLSGGLNFFGFTELQQGARRYLSTQGFTGESDPQSILNARIGVEGNRWGTYLTAENLLDESGYTQAAISSTDFNTTIPQPRTIGLLLRTNY